MQFNPLLDMNLSRTILYMLKENTPLHSRLVQRFRKGPVSSGTILKDVTRPLIDRGIVCVHLKTIRSGVPAKVYSLTGKGKVLAEVVMQSGLSIVQARSMR